MLTVRADAAHHLAALAVVGVDDYFTKSFVQAELLAWVQTLLARHNVRCQFAAQPEDVPGKLAAAASAAPETGGAEVAEAAQASPADAGEQLAQWQAQMAAHLANEPFGPAELKGTGRERVAVLIPAGRAGRPHAGLAARVALA